ncbi:MAG: class I SAM-dependent methyltransferase [Anaerolineae bacterium]|nr:class I SAM-dependent methyltransferase [Anaerolineae bacterium]
MGKFSEWLLFTLNRYAPPANRALLAAKSDPNHYRDLLQARSESSFELFGDLNLEGKIVLDVGCGMGSNIKYLYECGARNVVAFDIDLLQLRNTHTAFEDDVQVSLLAANAELLPFENDAFDTLVATDTFEHLCDVETVLRECYRVLRPGGEFFLYYPPFYAPWGAHMVNWIRVPWCQVFFSESTIMRVARRLELDGSAINSQLPPETRLDLQDGETIPFVNHLTLRGFREALTCVPGWLITKCRRFPPGWRSKGVLSKVLRVFVSLPLLKEIFTAKAVFVLYKE